MKTISKILSVVLCLAMVVGMFVVGATAAVGTGTYTEITRIADLTAGTYKMAAKLSSGNNAGDQSAAPYHLANGTNPSSKDLGTTSYSYANGVLTVKSGATDNAVDIELIAVEGKANTYYIKYDGKYLYSASTANRKLAWGNTATEWVATNDSVGGINLTSNGVTLGSADATKDFLRSYTSESTLKYGVVFFKSNSAPCTHEGKTHTTKRDASQHWSVCECGSLVGEKAPHTLTDGVCTCGYRAPVAPALGKTYKVGTLQVNNNAMIYLDGTITGRFLNTTTDYTKAADVFVEAAGSDTWYLFFMIEGKKSYIDLYVSDSAKGYVNARLNATPTVAYTYNTEHNTFLAPLSTEMYGDDLYMIAANDSYNTMGSSHDGNLASYFSMHLYAAAEHTHTYDDKFAPGETGHYQTCTICGYNTPESAHADANNDQKCDGCGTNVACTHSWKDKTSDDKHWEECEYCHEKKNEATHSFTKKTSDSKHWEECTCGLKKGEGDHAYTEGKCTCGATDPNYKAPEKEEDKKPAEPVIDYGVTAPKAGTAFKLGMYQENVGKYLYFNNTIPNAERPYYLGTTDKYSEAVDVYAEEVTGGYKLYFMDGTTKTYIDIYTSESGYVNARLTTEPTAVYTWNTEYKTFVTKVGDTEYYIGTYNTFETLSASKLSYAATSFPTHLYAEEPAPTADNSVISVAVAAAVLSVLGATALIMKKKEF